MSRRSPVLALGTLALALALAACTPEASDDSAEQPAPETVTVTQTVPAEDQSSTESSSEAEEDSASSSDDPERTDRGNISKKVGDEAGLTTSSGDPVVDFTVTDIQTDFQCTNPYAEGPENGSFVKVDIEATTGSTEALEEAFFIDSFSFTPFQWKFVDSSGHTANEIATSPTFGCLEGAEAIPSDIGPKENVAGSLILDIPENSGTLIFEPAGAGGGWEWSL